MRNRKWIFCGGLGIIFLSLTLFFFFKKENNFTVDEETTDFSVDGEVFFEGDEMEIIELLNEERKRLGLEELEVSEYLMQTAKMKAEDMALNEYFDHVSPSGLRLYNFLDEVSYDYFLAAENLAKGFFSAKAVFGSWMSSEEHRKNILSSEFEDVGVAIYYVNNSSYKGFVFVQHFATKMPALEPEKSVKVCKNKIKEDCEKVAEALERNEESLDKVNDVIDTAKDQGALDEYLEELFEQRDELDDAIKKQKKDISKCEQFINSCQRWED